MTIYAGNIICRRRDVSMNVAYQCSSSVVAQGISWQRLLPTLSRRHPFAVFCFYFVLVTMSNKGDNSLSVKPVLQHLRISLELGYNLL
uniref:Uncharacterized protein n=1 Tax=Octopus bimaculoides TaxID=37653 RepID=A0A0L8FW57_OCTBM